MRPNKKPSKPYDPFKLHRDLKQAGLKVISCDANGFVILDGVPTPEQALQVDFIKMNHHLASLPDKRSSSSIDRIDCQNGNKPGI